LLSHHQNAGQNHDIKIANRSFEDVAQFRYLRTTVTNQNWIQEEIKWRLNSSNACQHSVQNLLSSQLLSKHIKVKIYKAVNMLIVLYGHETWSLTLREEHKLRVFEKKVLKRIFRPKRDEVIGGWRHMCNEELHSLHFLQSIIRMINTRRVGWAGHVAQMGRKGTHIGY
jgi:hypothetical protein